jgi:hypothetical protein
MDVGAELASSEFASSEFVAPDGVVVDTQVVVAAGDDGVPGMDRAPNAPTKPTAPKALTATPAVSRSSFRKAALRARILLSSDIARSCMERTMALVSESPL